MRTILPNLPGTSVIGTLEYELVILKRSAILVVEVIVDVAIDKLVVEDELVLTVVPVLPTHIGKVWC